MRLSIGVRPSRRSSASQSKVRLAASSSAGPAPAAMAAARPRACSRREQAFGVDGLDHGQQGLRVASVQTRTGCSAGTMVVVVTVCELGAPGVITGGGVTGAVVGWASI
jgi:hypothetical protein